VEATIIGKVVVCVEEYHPKLYHIVVTFKLAVALEMTENMVHMAYGLLFETF
jgi:hypothetical protein